MNQALSIPSAPSALRESARAARPDQDTTRSDLAQLEVLKVRLLEALESTDKDQFCEAFDRAQKALRLDDNDLAKALQVSRPTVGRWANGVTAPHPIGRKPVLEFLLKRVESSVRLLKR